MKTRVIEDAAELGPYLDAWDRLAVAAERPFCAPAWMLSWWHAARTGDARLRVIVVLDEDEVAGIGPFFAQVSRLGLAEMRLLAAGFSHRIGPLARAGAEGAVAEQIAHALAAMSPTPASIVLEGVSSDERWPDLLAAAWPSKRPPRRRLDLAMDAPVIDLAGSYESWLERRDRRFRKEARRTARKLQQAGVECRVASDDQAIDTLMRLHHARWDSRGGSHVGEQARDVIAGAARDLGASGRLAVVMLESAGGAVAAELVVRAGRTAVFWGGGFDPSWSQSAPGTQVMLQALRMLSEGGVQVADLGGGAHSYKRRLADGNVALCWHSLFLRGARYPLLRAQLAPKHARMLARDLARQMPAGAYERLRGVSIGRR